MARRSYEQACTTARTLDIVGGRWTLLLVRELMLGPRRFADLLEGLPGIGRNLLAQRLKELEAEGILRRRRLPAPAASWVYELTEDGWALGPALSELGRWGAERLGPPSPKALFRPAWAMFPMSYLADAQATRGVRETYEFRIGDDVFHLRVRDGAVTPRNGPVDDPDLVATMEPETLRELFFGDLDPMAAVATGRIRIEAEPEVLARAVAILARTPAAPASGSSPSP
jgi:DNA-binding HxlR family transcriptional regulator